MDFSKIIIGVMRWGIWGANHSESGVQKLIETSLEEGLYTFDHADIMVVILQKNCSEMLFLR